MRDAEMAADAMRVSYWGRDNLPDDLTYTEYDIDMYMESKYGNCSEIPMWEDPFLIAITAGIAAGVKTGIGSIASAVSYRTGTVGASKYAYKAIDNLGKFTVSAKHLSNANGDYAKFATTNATEARKWVLNALLNAKEFMYNSPDSYYIIVDIGDKIGTKGETSIKVVFTTGGNIITAYPIK